MRASVPCERVGTIGEGIIVRRSGRWIAGVESQAGSVELTPEPLRLSTRFTPSEGSAIRLHVRVNRAFYIGPNREF